MEQELIDEYNRGLSDGVRMNLTGETAYLKARIRGLEEKLKEAMHWLPMTEDAVFEDGGKYLGAYKWREPNSSIHFELLTYEANHGWFVAIDPKNMDKSSFDLSDFTHYARITEPK